jgi:hypothetical protein
MIHLCVKVRRNNAIMRARERVFSGKIILFSCNRQVNNENRKLCNAHILFVSEMKKRKGKKSPLFFSFYVIFTKNLLKKKNYFVIVFINDSRYLFLNTTLSNNVNKFLNKNLILKNGLHVNSIFV